MYVDPSGHEVIAVGLITMAYYALIALLAIYAISTIAYIESETHFIGNSLTSLGNAITDFGEYVSSKITDLFTSEIAYSGNTITNSQEVIVPSNFTLAYNLDNVYYYKRKKAAPRIRSNSKKRAREKAFLKGGKVTPIHHPNGKYGPHFHPRDPRFSHWHYYYLWLLLFREYDE